MDQMSFPPEEYRARRQKVLEAIGDGAVAVLQGADGTKASGLFRQDNEFYYLGGVEVPHAYLLLDGRSGRSILLLPRESQIEREHDGFVPSADAPERVAEMTGVDEVLGVEHLAGRLRNAKVAYTPFRPGQGLNMTYGTLAQWDSGVLSDPWDGRLNRAANLIRLLRRRFAHLELRDLLPVVEQMRLVKSELEVARLRRAGRLTAEGVREAMRCTRPGVMEYQLGAVLQYTYLAGGARGVGYHPIIAGGANAWHGHYKRNDSPLADGDWVLCDCAPDYRYYTSDIGRMWPVNGTYSPVQRELYGFVVEYHKVLLAGIRPGRTCDEIHDEAAEAMRKVLEGWHFSSPLYEAAARRMFEFRGHLSHSVGMCVHDGGGHRLRPLEKGIVFSVDPQMRVPEERLYIRAEDTVAVTDDGIENLTADAPLELDDVEAFMRQEGLLQAFPPVSFDGAGN
ncbi:MAG TPA: Xaa-Pro peptidase family protein [Phycisphaerae bacterium]|nr:Xaa-Pro peptidase family protein [Phycisphaerae bacterium]